MSPEIQEYNWPKWPVVDRDTFSAVNASLYTSRWAIASGSSLGGSRLDRVEAKLAALFGRKFGITTCNGSAAIVIALQSLNIGPGDRVLLPALTWVGCATAILRVGAVPVFADSGKNTPLMEISESQRAEWGTIDAILAVHLYASQLEIETWRQAFPNIPIIEDCSHCQGAVDAKGQPLGSRGEITICSFQSSKILTCGEGGVALTDDSELAQRLAALRADSRVRPRQSSFWQEVDLKPYPQVQGANFALSEIAAGLLLDQLQRLPEQTQQRGQGLNHFLSATQKLGLEVIGDTASYQSGAFYGVMVWLGENFFQDTNRENWLRQVKQHCNIALSPVYPPIPCSPLYHPRDMKQYAHLATANVDLTYANKWHESGIVIPHWAFLAKANILTHLAEALEALTKQRSLSSLVKQQSSTTYCPEITVIIVTHGKRSTLELALASVDAQNYPGRVQVLILKNEVDSNQKVSVDYSARFPFAREISIQAQGFWQNCPTVARIARLRNVALEFVTSPLVCFLDDDNVWDSHHLSSLWQTMATERVPAAHSWRRLVNPNGADWQGDCFPWLPSGTTERHRYNIYLEHGLFSAGSNIVKDTVSLPIEGEDFGMVDMGEWLLETALIQQLRFFTTYSKSEIATMFGEDDKLLKCLRELGVDTACSNQETLTYHLGGMSNTFNEHIHKQSKTS